MNCVADMKASTTPRRDAGCAKSRRATILGPGLDSRAGLLQKLLKIAHTVGHALEELIDFTLRHGEAVGIVMVAAALIAAELGRASPSLVDQLETALEAWGLPYRCPPTARMPFGKQ